MGQLRSFLIEVLWKRSKQERSIGFLCDTGSMTAPEKGFQLRVNSTVAPTTLQEKAKLTREKRQVAWANGQSDELAITGAKKGWCGEGGSQWPKRRWTPGKTSCCCKVCGSPSMTKDQAGELADMENY